MSEIEQLRSELERTRAVVEANKRNFKLAFAGMKAELERVNAACEEMRDAIQEEILDGPFIADRARLQKALSTDAGKGYVPVEKVKPLVEALRACVKQCDYMPAHDGLAAARELGI